MVACALLTALPALSVARSKGSLPLAPPQRIAPPRAAPYMLPDGSIYVAGNDLLDPVIQRLNGLFQRSHPGFKFRTDMYTSGLAVSGLTAGKSAFGPTARDITYLEIEAFTSRYGYPPTDIQIGWDNTPDAAHFPPGKFPPGVWVNARNPVPALTVQDVISIFTTGSGKGDVTHWGQLHGAEGPIGANGGDWAKREIHVYMPELRGLPIISTTRLFRFGGLPWTRRAEFLPMIEDVINAVANDPFGIGLIGWWPTDEGWDRQVELGDKVRLLPLARDKERRISRGAPGDLYPLAGGVHIIINKAPGRPLEPWLKEYLRLALSPEGQNIIRSMTKTDGFIPLDPDEIPAQLAKLE